jgi:hypothetical protein
MTDFPSLFGVLQKGNVEYILVGGMAATAHGSARLTVDLDIVYRRTPQNLSRIVAALAPLHPYLRGAPQGLPFVFDERTLERGLNFTLTTSSGDIDLLGEIAGGGRFEDLAPHSTRVNLYGLSVLCLNLDQLIHTKRAAGRPRDFDAIAELEALREEKGKS